MISQFGGKEVTDSWILIGFNRVRKLFETLGTLFLYQERDLQ